MSSKIPLNFSLKIKYLYEIGWSIPKIAIHIGLSRETVYMELERSQAPLHPTPNGWNAAWQRFDRSNRIRGNPINDHQAAKHAC